MSILAAAPAGNFRVEILFAAVCLAVGLGTAAWLRRWRTWRVDLPERVAWRSSIWPLVVVLIVGVVCWFGVQFVYFAYKQAALMTREGPDARLDLTQLTSAEWAFLATVPVALAFLVLLAGNAVLRRLGGYDLGFGLRRLKAGIVRGVVGSVCVVPLMFAFMVLVDWAYRWVGYEHPKEHELLRALGESHDPGVRATLIVGAALAAPLFEELLFRGHLQTVLRRAFTLLTVHRFTYQDSAAPVVEPAGTPAVALNANSFAGPAVVEYAPPAADGGAAVPPAWATWAAIVLTSMLFALVHPPWTWPPIFALSLCLGYAYERTGNLWVPILIHASFNTASTLLYLSGVSN